MFFILLLPNISMGADFFNELNKLDKDIEDKLYDRKETAHIYNTKIEEWNDKIEKLNDELEKLKDDMEEKELEQNKRIAEDFYKKSKLIFDTFRTAFLEDSASLLLRAIELDSDNEKYKNYLSEIYRKYWEESKKAILNKDVLIKAAETEKEINVILDKEVESKSHPDLPILTP